MNIWEGGVARQEAERFREIWDIRGPILLDENAELAERLGVRGVPTNVLVDADGTVRGFGLTRLDELEAAVDELLGR